MVQARPLGLFQSKDFLLALSQLIYQNYLRSHDFANLLHLCKMFLTSKNSQTSFECSLAIDVIFRLTDEYPSLGDFDPNGREILLLFASIKTKTIRLSFSTFLKLLVIIRRLISATHWSEIQEILVKLPTFPFPSRLVPFLKSRKVCSFQDVIQLEFAFSIDELVKKISSDTISNIATESEVSAAPAYFIDVNGQNDVNIDEDCSQVNDDVMVSVKRKADEIEEDTSKQAESQTPRRVRRYYAMQ